MFNRDRWKEILEVLTSNWFRTVLTAFGVFWGILILIILLAAGKGLENGIKSDFGDIATNTMFIWTRRTTKAHMGLPKDREFSFKTSDRELLESRFPELRYISPRNQLGGFRGGSNVIRGIKTGAYNIYGDYPEIINQDPMGITAGRFLNQNDIREKRKIAVIGEGVVSEMYDPGEEVLGSYLKIQGVNFMVVGTYKKKSNDGDGEEGQKQIFVPFTTFSQAFNRADNVGWMAITANDGTSITSLKEQIVNTLKEKHKVHPDDQRAIGYFDLYEQYNRVESLFGAMRFIAYFVGILVLLSGIIGVSNIMLIVVKERTKEIGIRKALGARPIEIVKLILMESIVITALSGFGGMLFSMGVVALIAPIVDAPAFSNPNVDNTVVIICTVVLILAGVLAGLVPSIRAANVKPIDALRAD